MHCTQETLVAYVTGALNEDEARAVEAHAAECAACAGALRREATLEVALHESARAPRRIGRVTVALALAAAVVLAVLLARSPLEHDNRVICPDGPDQAACIRAAHRRGLMVDYPPSAPALALAPTYEGVEPLFHSFGDTP